jgi:hypothetical protein
MSIKTARGGLEVGAIWTPAPEIDPPPKTAVLTKLLARKLCSYLAGSLKVHIVNLKFAQKYLKIWLR